MVEDLTAPHMGCPSAAVFDASTILHERLLCEAGLAAIVALTVVATIVCASQDLRPVETLAALLRRFVLRPLKPAPGR